MPALSPPRISLVSESPTIIVSPFSTGPMAAKTWSKNSFFGAKLLGEEHAVHQRTEAGARQLLRLRDDRTVRDDALAHLAAQRLDDLIAVVAVDDGVAQTQLVGIVKLRREGNVDALLREKLLKAADEHLRLRDLAALEFFPVFHIQNGIARDLSFRAFAKAELNKKALDGGALGGIKV